MKWFSDSQDLGLVDGLIWFLLVLYFLTKTVIYDVPITRPGLAVLALCFLYFVVIVTRIQKTRRRISPKIREEIE